MAPRLATPEKPFRDVGLPGVEGAQQLRVDAGAGADHRVRPAASHRFVEAHRIRAGIPRMGSEIDERTIPASLGVVAQAVSFTKGCYTGQEVVARIHFRGHVNRLLQHLDDRAARIRVDAAHRDATRNRLT